MIRKDLFAVKVLSNAGDGAAWCVQAICRSFDGAQSFKRMVQSDHRREYPLSVPRIVNPRQEVVDLYLLMGNTIRN